MGLAEVSNQPKFWALRCSGGASWALGWQHLAKNLPSLCNDGRTTVPNNKSNRAKQDPSLEPKWLRMSGGINANAISRRRQTHLQCICCSGRRKGGRNGVQRATEATGTRLKMHPSHLHSTEETKKQEPNDFLRRRQAHRYNHQAEASK